MQFETALAKATLDNVALRDPEATDHKTTFAELQKLAPQFDWNGYFQAAKLPEIPVKRAGAEVSGRVQPAVDGDRPGRIGRST